MRGAAIHLCLDGSPENRLKMKILLVAGSFPPMKCGVGDYSYRLAKALAADGMIELGVLTSACDEEVAAIEGVEIFPVMETWRTTEALRFIKLVRGWSPDIVHIQYPTQGYGKALLPWLLPLISFLLGKRVVQTWHEGGYARRDAPKLLLKTIVPGRLIVVHREYKKKLHPTLRWALWTRKPVFIRSGSTIPKIDLTEKERHVLKTRYLKGQARLVVFFGFVYPYKRAELLLEIANPISDHIVIAGEIDKGGQYNAELMKRANAREWANKVTITGYLSSADAAALLAVADAVVLPFREGGGEWNTSIYGAVLQGTLVITTSTSQNGYHSRCNVYYAKGDGVEEMRSALDSYAGRRRQYDAQIDGDEWRAISNEHYALYAGLSAQPGS